LGAGWAGDNFHAACKYPTEQILFSLLNNTGMLHSPYGQFIASLWCGSESRINVDVHTKQHYQEMKGLLLNGITIYFDECVHEKFNLFLSCVQICVLSRE